jgi:TatD DNase family protein
VYDSHCHLDVPRFDADRAEVVLRAGQAGVAGILVPAIRPATFAQLTTTQVAARAVVGAPTISLAIGVHPQVVPELDEAERVFALDPDAIAAAASAHGAVAIGECGLDGGTADPEQQERILRAHIRAARLIKLPLVLHVLRAHGLAPRVLAEEGARDVGGVMHSYSGGAALIPVYRDLGFAFSLAGPVTFPGSRRPVEAARLIPADLLLAETDAPDQSPSAHRGQRNEPAFLPEIVAALAAARNEPVATIAALTARNAARIFRLPPGPVAG